MYKMGCHILKMPAIERRANKHPPTAIHGIIDSGFRFSSPSLATEAAALRDIKRISMARDKRF